MAERQLTDQYTKGNPGATIDADLIAGGPDNQIPNNALPDGVVTRDSSAQTAGDNATLLGWRQDEGDSAGDYALWAIQNPDGTAAEVDQASSTIRVKGQFTDAEVAEGKNLFKDIEAGGWERDNDIRLYGGGGSNTGKTTAYTQAQARAAADSNFNAGRMTIVQGTSETRWFLVETRREIGWTDDPLRYRIVDDEDSSEEAEWLVIDGAAFHAAGDNGLADGARRLFYTFQWTIPAGGGHLQAQRDKETQLQHITLADNSVGGDQLDVPSDQKVGGNYLRFGDDGETLSAQHLPGVKQLFAGSFTPLNITLNANSGVVRIPFTNGFNLRDVTHGEIEGIMGFTIISRSDATIGWDASADDSIEQVVGVITVEDLVNAPRNIDGGVDVIVRDFYLGANPVGVVHIRAAADALDDSGLNWEYEHEQGGTGATATISATGAFYLRETGVPVLTTPPIFESALPAASGYADGTVAYVLTGSDKGVHIKRTRIMPGTADTGLAGLVIDPNVNMRQTVGGRYTHYTWARRNFTARRDQQAILANANAWTVAPAALDYIDFNYRTATRQDGQIDVVYNAARQFTGSLILTPAGQYPITLLRQDATRWSVTGLSGPQVTAWREHASTWHDTGAATASTTIEEWVHVAA